MAIQVGEKLPQVKFKHLTKDGMKELSTDDVFKGKKVALFALPGAFTPTCSAKHLPGYVQHAKDLHHKGIDSIVCLSVNDAFVMDAWGRDQRVGEKVLMLADGNAEFTKALGLEMDASGYGMGTRSKRYSMVVDDGVVRAVNVEKPGEFGVSSAETMLTQV